MPTPAADEPRKAAFGGKAVSDGQASVLTRNNVSGLGERRLRLRLRLRLRQGLENQETNFVFQGNALHYRALLNQPFADACDA